MPAQIRYTITVKTPESAMPDIVEFNNPSAAMTHVYNHMKRCEPGDTVTITMSRAPNLNALITERPED